jgi:hypothetical protein
MLADNPKAIDYLRDIIVEEMNMADDRVNVYNSRFVIPNDKYLFIGIDYKYTKVIGAKSETAQGTDFIEKQGLVTQEHYAIILFSRNMDALNRKEEAVMALGSIYARQQGDAYGFSIARIGQIKDLSDLEGAAILWRYEIDVVMFCRYEKIKTVPWYGTFAGAVTVADGAAITSSFSPSIPK